MDKLSQEYEITAATFSLDLKVKPLFIFYSSDLYNKHQLLFGVLITNLFGIHLFHLRTAAITQQDDSSESVIISVADIG